MKRSEWLKALKPFFLQWLQQGASAGLTVQEGPGIDLVGATVGLGGDGVLLYDAGGDPVREYAADGAGVGLDAALAASAASDVVALPAGTIGGDHTIPAGVTVEGMGEASVLSGTITNNGILLHLLVSGTLVNNATLLGVQTAAGVQWTPNLGVGIAPAHELHLDNAAANSIARVSSPESKDATIQLYSRDGLDYEGWAIIKGHDDKDMVINHDNAEDTRERETLRIRANDGAVILQNYLRQHDQSVDSVRGLQLLKYSQIVTAGGAGAWDADRIDAAGPVWFDEQYQRYCMFYTGMGGTPSASALGLLWSDDLLTWERDAANPVLEGSGGAGDPDEGGVTAACLYIEDGVYYLFYIGMTDDGYEAGDVSTCLATSTDLYTWTRQGQQVAPAGAGWMATRTFRSSVVKVSSVYYLFFNACGADGVERIGYATSSSLLGPWTVDTANSPVLDVGGGGAWDDTRVADPYLYKVGKTWYMYYYGHREVPYRDQQGVAWTTEDLFPLGWTKYAGNPILANGAAGSFDEYAAFKVSPLMLPGIWFLYYTAIDSDDVWSFGLALSEPLNGQDHGALFGLADDDHAQYLNTTRHDTATRHALGTVVPHDTVNGLTDATITAPTTGEVLTYHSGTWVNAAASGGAGELLMQDGVTAPPVPIETEAQDDWLYEG